MSGPRHWEQDKEATVYIGNLDERVSDNLVWELMLQAGRIANVHLPKDRVTQTHQGYGFVEFNSEEDAEYASRVMNQIRLFGKPIRVNKASADKHKAIDTGAELFVGNLDPMVTEQTLFDTFSRFGALITAPKVTRDDFHSSKGYGFVAFANFDESDEAIAHMNGQYLMNKQIAVQYAYKKDGKGERHGDIAERTLAAQATKHGVSVPPQIPPIARNNFNAGHASNAMMNDPSTSIMPRQIHNAPNADQGFMAESAPSREMWMASQRLPTHDPTQSGPASINPPGISPHFRTGPPPVPNTNYMRSDADQFYDGRSAQAGRFMSGPPAVVYIPQHS